jgi:cellulose synthase/poly-beta-1,6-N-acetylglucosamine synthase-like glycosyltransferase
MATIVITNFFIQLFYIASISFKLIISLFGELETSAENVKKIMQNLKDEELPFYTILLPVYKEKEIVKLLLQGIANLDYPKERYEILILLEEDDEETIREVEEHLTTDEDLKGYNFIPIIVPDYQPKTKPKACNYGLIFSRGKHLVIYDAEDIPEPNQLKMAVAAFQYFPEEYICFQAHLNYYNTNQNFLTKMFTLEYSYWFDYMLPGLFKLNLPIPLGGTSNHFRMEKLIELGGWDPYNMTEDADLGMRAYLHGYKVGVIDSTTYEEANSKLSNWIRQRSRWIKGYMQTWLVYNREPLKMIKEAGFRGYLAFNMLIGGTPFIFLVNPIQWTIFLLWLLTKTNIIAPLFPSVVYYTALFNLILGNFLAIYLNMLPIFRRRLFHLFGYALLNPAYWVLHSIAAYKALWQLIFKPYYWEKTNHGLSDKKYLDEIGKLVIRRKKEKAEQEKQ